MVGMATLVGQVLGVVAQIDKVMTVAKQTGALVMVHAENYDMIRFLTERCEDQGQIAPYFHTTSRPIASEREATHRALALAETLDRRGFEVFMQGGLP